MAKLSAGITFTGKIGNVTAYKMRGVEGIILRSKGGASKEKIRTLPDFENTRKANAEFGGRGSASRWVMHAMWPHKALADYNIAGPVNALMQAVLLLDTVSVFGKRNVALSKNPRLLEGFSFNRNNPFDSTVRYPVAATIARDTLSAKVDIPALLPGINFFGSPQYPMYSLTAVLGVIPDLFYSPDGYTPSTKEYKLDNFKEVTTDWYPVQQGSPAQSLEWQLGNTLPDDAFSLVLSIGVRYGVMLGPHKIDQAKYAGCAKVLAMG